MAFYDAFVSYSHAKDKPIAAALQSVVQKLGKPWYQRRALRVFRDDTSLSATPHLWPTIELALGQSRYFILLASPEAAVSKWVNRELAYWLDHNSIDTVLIGVTDGELAWDEGVGDFASRENMPLPPALAGRFANEPKWVDLRGYRSGVNSRDAKFIEHSADLAAAIHGTPKEDLLSQEVRQQRRALTLCWSAVGSLMILSGLATWQWRETTVSRRVAVAEAVRAERNFGAAKTTVDSVIVDLVEGLKDVEGLRAEAARRILSRAEAAVGQLAVRTEDDPEVRISQAVMFEQYSDIYFRLGDMRLAVEYAWKPIETFRALAAKEPSNSKWRHLLSLSLITVGKMLAVQGDRSGALTAHRESLDIVRALAAEDPGNTQRKSDLSVNLQYIGDALVVQGDRMGALDAYREALDIARALAAKEPGNTLLQQNISSGLERVGDTLLLQTNRTGALAAYREMLDIARTLVATDPNNTAWQHAVTTSLERIGSALLEQGDVADALASQRESLDAERSLAAKDPSNKQWRRDVSIGLEKVGIALHAQGDLAGALSAFRESLDIRRELAAKDPSNGIWQRDVVISLDYLARAGDRPRERWMEVRAILTRLKSENRLTPEQQGWIGRTEAELVKLPQTDRPPSPTAKQIDGTYIGTNTQMGQTSGEAQISLTFRQSNSAVTATYQTSGGGKGKGVGTITGNVISGMILESEVVSCPGLLTASLTFLNDTVSWNYTGQDCGSPVRGRGQAKKVKP
jgi:tetratricopeptide (TPR) repeat protein